MTINSTHPLILVPAAVVYVGLGVAASCAIFNKLSHLAEYTLNKTFGDYNHPHRTLDNRVIVSMPRYQDYYYTQNIVLAALVAAISSQVIRILFLAGCPSIIAAPLLLGSVAASITCCLFNMIVRHSGGHHGRFVELTAAEVQQHGINLDQVAHMTDSERVYCGFGSAPRYFPGTNTHD